MKRRKQKPDLRRIRISQSYTVQEAAETLDRTPATVRKWIKLGLPVLPDTRPRLICGDDLKTWLTARWQAKKQPCGLAELYCFKCRCPRRPAPSSVATTPLSKTTATIVGKCGTCGTGMRQPRSLSKLPETIAAMQAAPQEQVHLSGYTKPPVKPTFWPDLNEPNLTDKGEGKFHVH